MPNPINIKELIADRKAGTKNWCINQECTELDPPDLRRITRLDDLEAAYIEAVELLREINTHWRTRQSDNFLCRLDQFLGDTE